MEDFSLSEPVTAPASAGFFMPQPEIFEFGQKNRIKKTPEKRGRLLL